MIPENLRKEILRREKQRKKGYFAIAHVDVRNKELKKAM